MKLRLAKSYVVGKVCARSGAAGGFESFPLLLRLFLMYSKWKCSGS
jgi:hypothetical protein